MRRAALGRARIALLVWPALLPADTPKEQPLGLILTPGDSKLVRAGSELPLSARAATSSSPAPRPAARDTAASMEHR